MNNMMLDMWRLGGMAMAMMISTEGNSQNLGQVRCFTGLGAGGQNGDDGEQQSSTFHSYLLQDFGKS